jgi:hypothetical protein
VLALLCCRAATTAAAFVFGEAASREGIVIGAATVRAALRRRGRRRVERIVVDLRGSFM